MMKTLIKISIIFILALVVSAFVSNPGISQISKDMLARSTTFNNPLVTYGPALDSPPHYMYESFENAVFPPPGWIKLNPDGGTGWNRQTLGTTPIPGWFGGTITAPPGGGIGIAFANWNTGGRVRNNQWLITPQLTNFSIFDSLSFWVRFWPDNIYSDTVDIKISISTPTVEAFTTNLTTLLFPRNSPDTLWTEYKYRIGDLIPEGSDYYIAFVERVSDNFYDGASVSLDLVSVYSPVCDPGTPHIEILEYPGTGTFHLEGRYIYQKEYLPTYPNDTEFVEIQCGINNYKIVDPCNPWVLDFYIAFYEDRPFAFDQVKVLKPRTNWDTTICQDMRFEVVYPYDWADSNYYNPLIPGSGDYFDSVVIKCTMIPHTIDGCVPDTITHPPQWWNNGPGFICPNWDTIYNWNCWRDCLNELIVFQCIDSCEVPNTAMCNLEFDKPLDVEITSFTAIVDNENIILTWTTATEKDNSGFAIERRSDGLWSSIGFVPGKGNSEVPADYTFTDNKLNSGSYSYRLKQIDYNGNFKYYDLSGYVNIGVPVKFSLSQNYPNPFNPATKIDFALPYDGNVMMKIYDLSGREILTVMNEFKTAGYYTINFNASNLASGIYYYKITAGNNTAVNKMVVIK